jgi:S1-C subfamily serine protease
MRLPMREDFMNGHRGHLPRRSSRAVALGLLLAAAAVDAFGAGGAATAATPALESALRRATVKLTCVKQSPDYYNPWAEWYTRTSTGSGAVIDGGLVLTNAHVVAGSRYLTARTESDPAEYRAEVVHIDHQCDLALVRVLDPGFHGRVGPVAIADRLPTLGSTVATYGFPRGGESVSVTAGVVSRVEYAVYSHGGESFLRVQTDAAINPGNSGGPVIQDGAVVGIAFQTDRQSENMGFMIPVPVIEHFLTDVRDGRCDGFPDLGIAFQKLDNPSHRRFLGMQERESGVLVTHAPPSFSAGGRLFPGDVLLAVDGTQVANDGSIPLGESRVPYTYRVDGRQVGERIDLLVLRGGRRLPVSFPVRRGESRIPVQRQHERLPRYLVYGGLVFQPLSLDYLEARGDWNTRAGVLLRHYFYHHESDGLHPHRREYVLISRVLRDRTNAYLAGVEDCIVDTIDGRPVTCLQEAAEILRAAAGDWVRITTDFGARPIVLRAAEMAEANRRIAETYDIPQLERLQ